MKATLEFNLPEDQEEFNLAINAGNWYCVAWDMSKYLRQRWKYEQLSEAEFKIIEEVREKLQHLINEQNVEL